MVLSRSTLVSCCLAVLLVACGGSPGGGASPEEVVGGLVDAARARDADRARALLPTGELMRRLLACPDGAGPIERVERARAVIEHELGELAGLTFRARDAAADEVERVAIGQALSGCEAREAFELRKSRITFEGKDGRTEHDTMRFVGLEGRYYLLNL
ncbi:MAG: hypothetical protein IT385_19050 [Deltaproteobacteria bacterium]|nr:hypothetical protein [Deltaproteobacteria bacterium]